jgi:hypothetical protein
MEVSGQLHAPAALPPGKEPLVPIGFETRTRKNTFRNELTLLMQKRKMNGVRLILTLIFKNSTGELT